LVVSIRYGIEASRERRGRVAELRLFGGATHRQVGEARNISPKTAEADWYFAHASLETELRK